MPKAGEKFKIRFESINGGMSVYNFTSNEDQFFDSLNISPDYNSASLDGRGTGPTVINPQKPRAITSSVLTGVPLWIVGEPKSGGLFLYDANGSVYTLNSTIGSISGLEDLNDGGNSSGDGCAYYDNYVYFARQTTIARYGPLNGTSTFTDDYWVGTLGKTALCRQAYPHRNSGYTDATYPRHVLHRHKDGKLYIADVVGNQGYIHFIQTSKTSAEGDTDAGSTYQKLALPYGYYPTDIESFGDDLVISAFEGYQNTDSTTYNSALSHEKKAALFFWDTVSSNYYKKIQEEFPDQIITALENANGILYTFSANISNEPTGVRVLRYLGGNSFEQITLLSDVDTPFAGGTASQLNQVLFGSDNQHETSRACVWSIGSQNQPLSNALFNVAGARKSTGAVHALAQDDGGAPWSNEFFYSYSNSNSSATVEGFGGNESAWDTDLSGGINAYWKSRWETIGSRFKITKVKLFFTDDVDTGTDIRIYVNLDRADFSRWTNLIGTIDYSSYPDRYGSLILKPNGLIGDHSFQIAIYWLGTANTGISLPIEVEGEIINDD